MPRKNRLFARVESFFEVLGAAREAATAVEQHRAPSARALRTLGIDAAAFKSMHL